MIKTILISLILVITSYSEASSFYIGSDYFKSDLNIEGQKSNPTMSSLRVGMNVWQQIAIEAQYNKSLSSDELFRFNVDLEESSALYARFISKEHNEITIDVSLGYSATVLTVNGPHGTFSGTDTYDGFAWGIAAYQRYESMPNARLRIAYQSLYDDDTLHIRGFSIGFNYNF